MIELPSNGSKATEQGSSLPPPPRSTSSVVSSLLPVATTPHCLKRLNTALSLEISAASCSSPKVFLLSFFFAE